MADKKQKTGASIIPGVLGGIIFLFFAFFLKFNIFFALLLGIAGFAGAILFTGKKRKEIDIIAEGITVEKYEETLKQGEQKLKTLAAFISSVQNVEVKKKIKEITDVVERIFQDLKKDPKDIKPAREFLNYYLDTTLNILNRYTEISKQNIRSAKVQESLKKVEGLLDTIRLAFERQLEKLVHDDIMDLDSEVKILEQMMKTEGME